MRRARVAASLLLLLIARGLWAQTSAEITGQDRTGAAATTAATTASGPVAAEDVTTYAADFEADNTETLSHAAGITIADNTAWSLSFWLQLETEGVLQGVSGNLRAANNYSRVNLQATDRMRLYGETNVWVEFADIDLTGIGGDWHHVVIVADGSDGNNIFPYLDGTAKTVKTLANTEIVVKELGSGGNSLKPFDGKLALYGVWSGRELLQADVTALYDAGPDLLYADLVAGQKTNLASWWDLEEESDARVDSHGATDLADNNTVGRAEVVYP